MAKPTWLQQLKPANFDGAGFHVDSMERAPGNNTVLREYPFQDLPTVFSMGEAAEEIKFSAYVIGSDYTTKRDALERALKKTESGVLMHPTLGAIRVWHIGKFSIKENPTAEGGVARMELTFVRAEPRRYPLTQTNTPLSSIAAALAGAQAAVESFTAMFDLSGAAGWVRDNVLGTLLSVESMIWDVAMAVKGNGEADGLSDLLRLGRASANQFKDLIQLPQDIAKRFASMLQLDNNLTGAQAAYAMAQLLPHDALTPPAALLPNALPMRSNVLSSLIDVELALPAAPYETPSRLIERAHIVALQRLVQRLSYCALVSACAQAQFDNYDVAFGLRRALHRHGLRLLQDASTETATELVSAVSVHDALLAVHHTGLSHVQAQSVDLARLVLMTPASETNVWAVSYDMYGTPDFADEIQAMNAHITNPLLVPAGVELRLIDHT